MKNTLLFLTICFSLLSYRPSYSQKDTLVSVSISKIRQANRIYYEKEMYKNRYKEAQEVIKQDSIRLVSKEVVITSYKADSVTFIKMLGQKDVIVQNTLDQLTEKDGLVKKLRWQKTGFAGLSTLLLLLLLL